MLLIEIVAAFGMLACLGQAARYAWRWERQLILPIGLYLTVGTMLGFAAFGGDSGLITDWETMAVRALGAAVLIALGAGYWMLVGKARAAARRSAGDGASGGDA
ncbi:MAG: hypothetical protein AAFV96_00360 [Pseudomonadota bacterium]